MRLRAARAKTGRSFALIVALIVAAVELADGNVALGAAFTVNSTVDAVDASPGDGICATTEGACSLRAAVQETNALAGSDRIIVPGGLYPLSLPFADPDSAAHGDIDILDDIEIEGGGASDTIVDGDALVDRVFEVHEGVTASLTGLTIQRGGHALITGGGAFNAGDLTLDHVLMVDNQGDIGVGIANFGTLTINGGAFSHNGASTSFGTGGAIFNGGFVALDSVSFTNNGAASRGGAIFNAGTASLSKIVMKDNLSSIPGRGGAIFNGFEMTVIDSDLTGNEGNLGGGIFNAEGAILTVNRSSVRDNRAAAGGGILNNGDATLDGVTVSANGTSRDGAGIYNQGGTLRATNTTISGNTSDGQGGGVGNVARVTICVPPDAPPYECPIPAEAMLTNVTISGNVTGAAGSGIFNESRSAITLGNTIVAGNGGDGNCSGPITSDGHNLDTDGSCAFGVPGDLPNTDPLLGPLADNGGPTQTHALLAGSAAIDAADPAPCPATDQRGVARPQDGNGDGIAVCDIGGFELEGVPPSAPTPSPSPVETSTRSPTPEAALPVRLPTTGGRPGPVSLTP